MEGSLTKGGFYCPGADKEFMDWLKECITEAPPENRYLTAEDMEKLQQRIEAKRPPFQFIDPMDVLRYQMDELKIQHPDPEVFAKVDAKIEERGGYLVPSYFVWTLKFYLWKKIHKKRYKGRYPYRGNRVNKRVFKLFYKWKVDFYKEVTNVDQLEV